MSYGVANYAVKDSGVEADKVLEEVTLFRAHTTELFVKFGAPLPHAPHPHPTPQPLPLARHVCTHHTMVCPA